MKAERVEGPGKDQGLAGYPLLDALRAAVRGDSGVFSPTQTEHILSAEDTGDQASRGSQEALRG